MLAKISLAISIVLAIAVGFLLIKTSGKSKTIEPVEVAPAFSGEGGPKPTVLAFVNGDTLNARYDFIVEKSKDLDAKMKMAEERVKKEYVSRQAKYEQDMRYAQEHPEMSDREAAALQQEMEGIQAEMDQIQQREVGVLQKKEEELQKDLQGRVKQFLDKYSKERGIDYVINHQSQFQLVLYGNSAYDITNEVIAGLNAEYKIEKERK